jgi:glycosyltransferase involved in cell wall biosynthesis
VTHPAISVVLPIYNRAYTIGSAVESVLAQTFQDLELILIDDASTDATWEVLQGMHDPRIRVFRHDTNQGGSATRNTGIEAARADWIAFQDSDDLWLPEKLERQMAQLTAPGANYVAAYCGMLVDSMDDNTTPARYVPNPAITPREGEILGSLLRQSFISTQTLVARRDLLLRIGGFDPLMPALQDWELMLRLAPMGPVALVDEPLVQQRFSENSITRSAESRLKARLRVLEKHHELLSARPTVLAAHHYTIAGALRQAGRLSEAADHMAFALRLQPTRPVHLAMAFWLALLRLWSRLDQRQPNRIP